MIAHTTVSCIIRGGSVREALSVRVSRRKNSVTDAPLARSLEVEPMSFPAFLAIARDAALIVLSVAYVVVHF